MCYEQDIYWRENKIQETLYTGQWHLSPHQSRQLGTSHSSPGVSSAVHKTLQNPLLELPSAAPLYFPESYQLSETCTLSKVILVLGKAKSSPYMFNILRCSACCRPSRTCITFNRYSTVSEGFVPHFNLRCTHCIVPKSLLSHLNSFHRGMFKLNTKYDAESLLYSLSQFEWDGHTVHMLTQWHLPPPRTSAVKSSLFMPGHSSPLPQLPGYIYVTPTVLVVLTMAGLFLGRPHVIHLTKTSGVPKWDYVFNPISTIWQFLYSWLLKSENVGSVSPFLLF